MADAPSSQPIDPNAPPKVYPRFIHLHTHSHYSLLQALPKTKAMVKAAVEHGMSALALTDSGNMYGTIEFYKECRKQGIKPIVGVDFYVAARTRFDKEPRIDNRRSRLVLLAKDLVGYKNLIKLVTDSYMEGFYYKPRIDQELIEKYKEGLIAISTSFSGDIAQAVRAGNLDHARQIANFYKKHFADDFYIEITHHPELEDHEEAMKKLVAFARAENIKIVAAHDTYYIKPDDKKARETMIAIQDQFSERNREDDADFSFISPDQAEQYFKDIPDALDSCKEINDKCCLEIPLGKWLFPDFTVASGRTADDELKMLTYGGLERRRVTLTPEVQARIDYELDVIKTKGYAPYFLVVADLLNYAHRNGILTNIRGSVAGSMVTYLTGITKINSIEYNIPFERFLNPERPSAPDVDMDYADNRRDQMISYAREKYGNDKVAQIGTFGTMMARGAVKDVARAMGFPYSLGDQISKLIPMGQQGFAMTIDRAMAETPELKELYDAQQDVRTVIDMAKQIEGCARHISVHAAGVVISPVPLTDLVPLQLDPKGEGRIITQYDMRSVDEDNAGLLKFDFLGIKNLSQLADAVALTEKIEGVKIDLDLIPVDDEKTYAMLARGETIGTFQLNGSGMTQALKKLKPTNIHDINVMVALYRPGPMETIDDYIERKHGRQKVVFYHPKMEKFLDRTFGLLVYQDDLLMTAIELAGYSWGEVDKFRKAVGKKIREEMAKQHEKFVEGCMKHSGISKKLAESIWKLFEPFQGYGFNKAHAASYGLVAYQTAYMKANYPAVYMAAVLTGAHGDVEEISSFIGECKRMKISVLGPSINESFGDFTVIKGDRARLDSKGMDAKGNPIPPSPEDEEAARDEIRFGLYSIKNFGEGIADVIIAERQENGPYLSLEDFLNRIKDKNLNKKSLEALIKTGAMDMFGDRGVMLTNLQDLLDYNKEQQKQPEGQDSLFGSMFGGPSSSGGSSGDGASGGPANGTGNGTSAEKKIGGYGEHLRLRDEGKATAKEKLAWEKELLGLYISGHPLDKYKEALEKREMNIAKLRTIIEEDAAAFAAKQAKEQASKDILDSMDRQMKIAQGIDPDAEARTLSEVDENGEPTENAKAAMKAAEEAEKKKKSSEPKKRFNKDDFKKQREASQPKERQVVVAGIIEEAKEIATKKDPTVRMMFLKLADFSGSIEVVVFPKTYEQFKLNLKTENCVAIKAKTSSRNGTPSLIVDTVKVLN